MFDPVPVKQEVMDSVSVVSFPKLNTSSYLLQVAITLLCVVLFLKVTHHLTGIW